MAQFKGAQFKFGIGAQFKFGIANGPHAYIVEHQPDVPPCVVAIINKALAKKVEERYQTGSEMVEAIRQWAASLQVTGSVQG